MRQHPALLIGLCLLSLLGPSQRSDGLPELAQIRLGANFAAPGLHPHQGTLVNRRRPQLIMQRGLAQCLFYPGSAISSSTVDFTPSSRSSRSNLACSAS